MTFYVYQDAHGRWRRPPKGIGVRHLIACYRHVRKIRVRLFRRGHTVIRNRWPIAWWIDGQQYPRQKESC